MSPCLERRWTKRIRYERDSAARAAVRMCDSVASQEVHMRRPNLQLTLRDGRFSVTPLPETLVSRCTAHFSCSNVASHRVLARAPGDVQLLCDSHMLDWASGEGISITTARVHDSAA